MSELGDKLRKLRQKYIDGGGRLYSAAEINADLRGLEQPPEAAPPRDIAQELIAGLEEVRDMRKCKKCEYPNCFCDGSGPKVRRSRSCGICGQPVVQIDDGSGPQRGST